MHHYTTPTKQPWIIGQILSIIPAKLRPYAKAVIPAATAVITIGVAYLATGQFDTHALEAAGGLAGASILTVIFPNAKK